MNIPVGRGGSFRRNPPPGRLAAAAGDAGASPRFCLHRRIPACRRRFIGSAQYCVVGNFFSIQFLTAVAWVAPNAGQQISGAIRRIDRIAMKYLISLDSVFRKQPANKAQGFFFLRRCDLIAGRRNARCQSIAY
jgi:hypothetical protein